MNQLPLHLPQNKLITFCQRWQITELALFGSVLRADFQPDRSDIDVLVTFAPDTHWSLFDHVDMQAELATMFNRPVDLLTKRSVLRSPNYLRRQHILDSAQVI